MTILRCVICLLAGTTLARGAPPEEPPAKPPHEIYQCTDAGGNTIFQDDPCVEAKPSTQPEAKPPAKRAKPSTKPAAKPSAKPAAKPAEKRTSPANKPVVVRTKPVLPSLTLPTSATGPIDARWATPDAALRTFITAIDAGDRALVVSCLAGDALADLGPDPETLPMEELQAVVASFTGYVTEGNLGPYWSVRALRAGMRPKWIFFTRTDAGAWKIGGI